MEATVKIGDILCIISAQHYDEEKHAIAPDVHTAFLMDAVSGIQHPPILLATEPLAGTFLSEFLDLNGPPPGGVYEQLVTMKEFQA